MAATELGSIPPEMLPYIPAGIPPNGTISNLVDPPSREMQTKMAIYASLPIMVTFLVLRLYTRARVTRAFGADDYLAIVSAICIGAYCGVLHYMLDGPLGEHVWDSSLASIGAPFQKSNLASQTLYSLAALFTKVNLLVLYLRIFHPSNRAIAMIWVGIVVVSIAYVAFAIAFIVVYAPSPGHQEKWAAIGSEARTTALLNITAVNGVFGILSDFYILLVPMHLVVGLHLPFGRKMGVCGIFLTGLSACICSIVGTAFRFRVRASQDPLWDTITPYSLGVVELAVGLICSCLPVLFVFLKRIARSNSYASLVRYFRTRRSDGRSQGPSNQADQPKASEKIQLSVPKPVMTGLRSFIRKAHSSQSQKSTEIESYDELESVNDDYHAQLKDVGRGNSKRQGAP